MDVVGRSSLGNVAEDEVRAFLQIPQIEDCGVPTVEIGSRRTTLEHEIVDHRPLVVDLQPGRTRLDLQLTVNGELGQAEVRRLHFGALRHGGGSPITAKGDDDGQDRYGGTDDAHQDQKC